jgi:gliding motility-associated-like protein
MSKIYQLVFYILLFLLLQKNAKACSTCTPLSYIQNKGQWDDRVLYKSDIGNGSLFLEKDKITFNLFNTKEFLYHRNHTEGIHDFIPKDKDVLHLFAYNISFLNANKNVKILQQNVQEGYSNYYVGSNKNHWASYVKSYEKISYKNIYNQVDLNILSAENAYKYEYVCGIGSNIDQIKMAYNGIEKISIINNKLYLYTSFDTIIEQEPYAYQFINGQKKQVACYYKLIDNIISFDMPNGYDKNHELVIDPVVIFSTYSGSFADNFGYCATYDSRGNAYAGGSAFGAGYPVTIGAYQVAWAGGSGAGTLVGTDIAITKYSANGRSRLYSTYLGGSSDEVPHSLIVNSNDELFILGTSSSLNYPYTARAFDTTFNGGTGVVLNGLGLDYVNGSDMIITRMSADGGSLIASTYLGGSGNDGLNTSNNLKINYADEVRGEIQIDENDNVYIGSSTYSANFPTTATALQTTYNGGQEGCIIKLDNNLSTLIYSTFYGGTLDDAIYSVEIDKLKNLYFTGGTSSIDFPIGSNPYRNFYGGGRSDGFVGKLNNTGNSLINCTFIGSSEYDQSYFVRLNKAEDVFLLGQTLAPADSFIINALYFNSGGGQFITKLKNNLDSLVWSTAFGTGAKIDISPTALLVDLCNKVYLAGWGGSVNLGGSSGLPFGGTSGLDITPDAFQLTTDNSDFYLLVIEDDASALSFGSCYGGPASVEHVDGGTSRFDRNGIIYQSVCASCGRQQDFPIYPDRDSVVSASNNSPNCNNAVFKIDFNLPIILADFEAPSVVCAPMTIDFTNTSTVFPTTTYSWDFGDSTTSTLANPSHSYAAFGTYNVRLIVRDPNACNLADTVYKNVFVLQNGNDTLTTVSICDTQTLQIGFPPINDTSISYLWVPSTNLNFNDIANPYAYVTNTQSYTCYITNGGCTDTFTQLITMTNIDIEANDLTVLCPNNLYQLSVSNVDSNETMYYEWSPLSNIIIGAYSNSPTVFTSDSTTFYVIGRNIYGCEARDTVTLRATTDGIEVDATATPTEASYDELIQLNAIATDIANYRWIPASAVNNANIANPTSIDRLDSVFIVEATNIDGCVAYDTVKVKRKPLKCGQTALFIPNAFSPNGDGNNDVFYVRGKNLTSFRLAIFDRWGEKMFETTSLDIGWDGTYKGKKIDPAVFGYVFEGVCATGEKLLDKGNITLIR